MRTNQISKAMAVFVLATVPVFISQPASASVSRCTAFRATDGYAKSNYGGGACAGSNFSMRIKFNCVGKKGFVKAVEGKWKKFSGPSGSDAIDCDGSIRQLIIFTDDSSQAPFQFYS